MLDAARGAGANRIELGVRSSFGGEAFLRTALRGPASSAPGSTLLVARTSGSGPQQVFELNGSQAPAAAFLERVRDVLSVRRDHTIDVRTDGARSFQDVVALIDVLVDAGGEVLLTTKTAERFGPQPPPPPPGNS